MTRVAEVERMGNGSRTAGTAGIVGKNDVAVRERLLGSATELFTRKGYAATTVREIVAAAKVTKPALYYYFRNKEGIFLELMQRAWSTFDATLDASREEPGSAKEKLLRLADRVLALFIEHIDVVRLIYSIYYGPPQGAPFFDCDAFHLRFREVLRQMVEDGIRDGVFRKGNVEDVTWAVIGAINVAMEVQLCHPEVRMGREGLARVLEVIFAGIAAEAGKPKEAAAGRRVRIGGAGARSRNRARKEGRR